jgi:hypothetical protein
VAEACQRWSNGLPLWIEDGRFEGDVHAYFHESLIAGYSKRGCQYPQYSVLKTVDLAE